LATNSKANLPAGKNLGNKIVSTTVGTVLMILSLAVVTVCVYAPIKYYAFPVPADFYNYIEQFVLLILTIGGISILILTVLALAIPYTKQKQAAIVQIFNGMFFEIKGLLWITCLFISVIIPAQGFYSDFLEPNWFFYLFGIPMTFLLLLLVYLTICYLKQVYYTGFMVEVVKKSLAGALLLYLINTVRQIIVQISDTDINQDHNRQLLTLLAINFLVLFIIAITGGFGIILAIAYTVLLFNYATKVINKARALHEASSQLARGDFDVVMPGDMGVLSPFAKSLNNIKEGFKVAVEEEVKSQNMKTQLISNVSHDLKTPLTSIITYVDLLKDENLDQETRHQYIDILDQKAKRLKSLIDDLFEASKASSGNLELHFEEVDAVALLRQTLGEMEESIKDSALQMRLNLPEGKVICELDGKRTYRVFENIISNILKYSLPGTRVYIEVKEDEKKVCLTFKNIAAYEMNFDPAEITERFTRGDKSRTNEGSGLGLAIAKSLVELQKGSLDIGIDGDLFKLVVTFPRVEMKNLLSV